MMSKPHAQVILDQAAYDAINAKYWLHRKSAHCTVFCSECNDLAFRVDAAATAINTNPLYAEQK